MAFVPGTRVLLITERPGTIAGIDTAMRLPSLRIGTTAIG